MNHAVDIAHGKLYLGIWVLTGIKEDMYYVEDRKLLDASKGGK